MVNRNEYVPETVTPPGDTLLETIEDLGISQAKLAKRMGRPIKTINEIINGKTAITPETALQLEIVLNIPASFWNNREKNYRDSLARIQERNLLEKQNAWIKKFPIGELVKREWISEFTDKTDQLRELLNFFGVVSPEKWNELNFEAEATFRTSPTFKADKFAVSAWLRKGELEAQKISCAPYNREEFRKVLKQIRKLTVEEQEIFIPEIVKLCSNVGVAVVFINELPKSRASGATRWLKQDKALIQLSFRYRKNDRLWFTFFHEAGHVLDSIKKSVFIECEENSSEEETRANRFASNFLIPPEEYKEFLKLHILEITKTDVIEFAGKIGIAPGIVVGRLQHDSYLPQSHFNDLKKDIVLQ